MGSCLSAKQHHDTMLSRYQSLHLPESEVKLISSEEADRGWLWGGIEKLELSIIFPTTSPILQ